jgi:hypothetical protein
MLEVEVVASATSLKGSQLVTGATEVLGYN